MHNLALTTGRFGKAFWTELRQLAVHWLYLMLHVLWTALLVWMFVGRDDRSAQALLETTLGRIAIGLISLVGLFLAGISASRSRQTKFQELEDALPTGFEVLTGRWLAGLLTLALFLVEPVAVAARQGPLASLLDELPLFLGEAALTIAFTSAAGWWLAGWLKLGRWAYPLLAAGWLAFLIGPAMLTDTYPPASLLNFMRQGVSFYSELWGRLVYGDQLLWFNLFYGGMLLLAIALLALGIQLRRFHRPFWWTLGILAAALVLASGGAGRYVAGVQVALNQVPESPFSPDSPAFTVTAYDLTLDMSNPQSPRFIAQLTLQNTAPAPLSELAFRLNLALAVSESGLPVEREGALLRVLLAEPLDSGASLVLALRYEGTLRLESVSDGVVEANDFIDPGGVRLTPQANWYPIPARQPSFPGLHDSAHIRLVVTNGGSLHFAANLPAAGENVFEAGAAEWVFLIGSPRLVVEQAENVNLITSQADQARACELASIFVDSLRTITPFFPEAEIHGLILMVLGEEGGLPEDTPPVTGYPLVVIPRYALANISANPDSQQTFVLRALAADLWRLSGGVLDPKFAGPVTSLDNAFNAVVGFLHLYVKENGDPERMLDQVQDPAQTQGEVDENQQALIVIYRQGGEGAVAAVLRQMYLRPDELRVLPYDSLAQWIREVGSER